MAFFSFEALSVTATNYSILFNAILSTQYTSLLKMKHATLQTTVDLIFIACYFWQMGAKSLYKLRLKTLPGIEYIQIKMSTRKFLLSCTMLNNWFFIIK